MSLSNLRKKARAVSAIVDDSTQVLAQVNVVLGQVDDVRNDVKKIKIAVYIAAGVLVITAITALVFLIIKKRQCAVNTHCA